MTRLLPVLIAVTLVIAFLVLRHEHHNLAAGVPGRSTAATVRVAGSVSPRSVTTRRPAAPSRTRHPHHPFCTDRHWRRVLTPAERFIDSHESGLDPTSREPTTGAFGLGQLEPQTYRNLGLPMSASPCAEIHAQRLYEVERYGSWRNALAHWKAVFWW